MQSSDMAQTSLSGDGSPPEPPLAARVIEVAWLAGLIAVLVISTLARSYR